MKNKNKIIFNHICMIFYTSGKFILLFEWIIFSLNWIKNNKLILKKNHLIIIYIFLAFLFSFFIALYNQNLLNHIIRNNFYTMFYIFVGYQIFKNKHNKIKYIISIISITSILQIILYILSSYFNSFRVFYTEFLNGLLGYTFGFSNTQETGKGILKLYSNITHFYLFLFPLVLKRKNIIHKFSFASILLFSASLTQYFVLFLYGLYFFIKLKKSFILKLLVAGLLLVIVSVLSFSSIVLNKLDYVINYDKDDYNTVTIRVVQSAILIEEIYDSYLVGKGLGYISKEYERARIQWKKTIKEYNRSMYENQYLDILMKFGIPFGMIIFYYYIIYPLKKLRNYKDIEEVQLLIIGYIGLIIYVGTNGNTFYAYSNMYIWGIILGLIEKINNQFQITKKIVI